MAQSKCSSHLLVAAFDFGTIYSGYAFSFRDNPLKVQTNQGWNAGSEKLISLKTPTCVLLNNKGEFHSFGFEAENKYASLAEDDEHHGWMLFRRFKMLLHNNQELSRKTIVDDINGKSKPAMSIFSMSIRYLRDHLLKELNNRTTGIEETDIQYVITVPAIWKDNAKQFMREAAEQADIDTSRLKLAWEPEAASIWCQIIKTEAKCALSGVGKYMVVDLGGGTADISVHEKCPDGTLKELHKTSGGPWGGMYVDQNYFKWLESFYGQRAVERLKMEEMVDYFDLMREFETKKRSVTSNSEELVNFRVAASLKEKSEEEENTTLHDRLAALNLQGKVSVKRDRMRIDPSIVRCWFDEPIDNIIQHMNEILAEPQMRQVTSILLVGGFGESTYVQDRIRKAFAEKRVIVPEEAGLAVLKGAVRFGHEPDIVSARVMNYTYGIVMALPFDPSKHLLSQKRVMNGEEVVDNIFDIFVRSGETIAQGHVVTRVYRPINFDKSNLEIYCSTDPHPEYVTDASCKTLGHLLVKHEEGETLT
ncbi:heat shock 70 kDa protein 12A-like [Mercenaria mercenaria]|uniref:heat shock 70 kDa protein 12A-like n=1 Tax=Mercenaria mercenaria TaxID=6596 RepID=UPI00234ED703|nr:heat shock 70 kDa protein 12A-like [Mercenaria mercenaria]